MKKGEKNFREDMYGIVLIVAIVVLILFIGYYGENENPKVLDSNSNFNNSNLNSDFIGKAFFLFEQKSQQTKRQIKNGFCTETDIIQSVPTGYNPFERGQIKYIYYENNKEKIVSKSDHCRNKQVLIEFNCDNYAVVNHKSVPDLWTEVDCIYGCDEEFGKCNRNKNKDVNNN